MSAWERFEEWNRRITLSWAGEKYAKKGPFSDYYHRPFAWLWFLIPIYGWVVFEGIGWEEDMSERRHALRERQEKLRQAQMGRHKAEAEEEKEDDE